MTTKQAGRPASEAADPKLKRTKTYLLAAAIRSIIQSGEIAPGAPLPSQREIEAAQGVSSITVRAALRELEAEGLIANIPGKGTSVSAQAGRARPAGRNLPAQRAHSAPAVRDIDDVEWAEVEAPTTFRTNANAEIAANYGLPEHTPLFGTDLLLQGPDGKRMQVKTYPPFATAVSIPWLGSNPFVPAVEVQEAAQDLGLELATTHYITARNATPDDASALRVPPQTALLVVRRITIHDEGPLVIEEITFNPHEAPVRYDI